MLSIILFVRLLCKTASTVFQYIQLKNLPTDDKHTVNTNDLS